MSTAESIAKALLKIEAVRFQPNNPITFKTGIQSPVYVDNRCFPVFPEEWTKVIRAFAQLIEEKDIEFDVVAGIETAGIPHSSALGFFLQKPSLFVRKQAKDHGTKKRVECAQVVGKNVLLIEDHVTTGHSSLSGVEALRAEGAQVTYCLAITSYEFPEAVEAFAAANVKLLTLTNFSYLLKEAIAQGKISDTEADTVREWLKDPRNWQAK